MEKSSLLVPKEKREAFNQPQNGMEMGRRTGIKRETSGKLVRDVKFPVSRHNPPRADTRTDGLH